MSTRVFLGNLPYNITNDELSAELSSLGHVPAEVKVITDRETGSGRGFAFAEFGSIAAAEAAIHAINGAMIQGRPIRADKATERPGGGGGGQRSGGGGGGGGYRGGGGGGGGRRDGGDYNDRGGRGGRGGKRERW